MKKSVIKRSGISVFSEGERYVGVRTKFAFAWVVGTLEDRALGSSKGFKLVSDDRKAAALQSVFDAIAKANLSRDEKRQFRRLATDMCETDLIRFAQRVRLAR